MDSYVPSSGPSPFWPGAGDTRGAKLVAKWNHLIPDAQFSAMEFYAAIEDEVSRHKILEIQMTRTTWKERGLLSSRREYLRLRQSRCVCDICAAPFGTDFFFSSWLVAAPLKLNVAHIAGMFCTVLLVSEGGREIDVRGLLFSEVGLYAIVFVIVCWGLLSVVRVLSVIRI